MTAALKPSGISRRQLRQRRRFSQREATPTIATPSYSSSQMSAVGSLVEPPARSQVRSPEVVQSLPKPKPLPAWLTVLLRLQQASSIISVGLISIGLVTYGWTVLTQQRWSQAYDRWESLQQQEQQLFANNELLKNEIAQQADNPAAGLNGPDPNNLIFVPAAPIRPAGEPEVIATEPQAVPVKPLGY